MTGKEILLSDIRAVREAINRDWADLASLSLSHDEGTALRAHIEQFQLQTSAALRSYEPLRPRA